MLYLSVPYRKFVRRRILVTIFTNRLHYIQYILNIEWLDLQRLPAKRGWPNHLLLPTQLQISFATPNPLDLYLTTYPNSYRTPVSASLGLSDRDLICLLCSMELDFSEIPPRTACPKRVSKVEPFNLCSTRIFWAFFFVFFLNFFIHRMSLHYPYNF